MTHASKLTWLAATLLTGTVARPAQALECEATADCPKGFECQEVGTADCPDIACAEGQSCDVPECTSEPFSECTPVECKSDDDCAEGMECYADQETVCGTTPCDPDAECPDVEPSCEEVSRNYCVPKYLLPCEADADCGPGFSCTELEACACSGSAGSAGGGTDPVPSDGSGGGASDSDPGGATPESEQNCTCEPSGEFRCELEEVACDADADCENGFTCEDNPEGGDCWASSDGQSGCTEPDPAKLCLPPYFDLAGSVDGRGKGLSAGEDSSGEGTGAAGEGGEASDEDDETGHGKRSSGCQIAGAVSGAPAGGLVSLLVLALVVTRRRCARH